MKKFLHKREWRYLVALAVALVVIARLVYMWNFQTLPQAAIHLMTEISAASDGQRVVVFSPHPDDETIGAGEYIAASTHAGAHVWVVLVTDGNKHGLEERRYGEFSKALEHLGVPPENQIFLGYPDGDLIQQDRDELLTKFNSIIEKVNPTIVMAPLPEDAHPDHGTTGQEVARLLKSKPGIQLYEYLVHHPRFPGPKKFAPELYLTPPIRLVDFERSWVRFMADDALVDRKHEAVLQYHSQLRVPILRSLLLSLIRKNEIFAQPSPDAKE